MIGKSKSWLLLAGVISSLLAFGGWSSATAQDGTPLASPVATTTGIPGAVAWLQAQQAADGGFIGFTGESDAGATIDAMLALISAEHAGVDTGDSTDNAVAYLESGDVALVYVQTGVGQAAKLVLGLTAAGIEPAGFANVDPLSIIQNGQDAENGIYGTGIYDHALAVMALVVTGSEVPDSAIDAFESTQAENGGWAFDASTDPAMADTNTTAMSVQALVAAGHGSDALVASGMSFLNSVWLEEGAGYSALPETLADANSTALVIQARIATGADVADHLAALAGFQNDSGAFYYNSGDTTDNLFATLQAVPALASLALPIAPLDAVATPVADVDALAA